MDYYEDMSAGCLGKELQIAVPTLAIHACDGKSYTVL
jgi:predicted alpha/beta-fold hydrolase